MCTLKCNRSRLECPPSRRVLRCTRKIGPWCLRNAKGRAALVGNKQTNKQTSRQPSKQTSRQINKQTNKQANKQTMQSLPALATLSSPITAISPCSMRPKSHLASNHYASHGPMFRVHIFPPEAWARSGRQSKKARIAKRALFLSSFRRK